MKQSFEWISVKDGLPEKSGMYLVVRVGYFIDHFIDYVEYSAEYKLFRCPDLSNVDEDAPNNARRNVIAWAEIPPYEEEKS